MNGYQTIGLTVVLILFFAVWLIFCISRAEQDVNEDQDEQL
jgi:hypothetical protein